MFLQVKDGQSQTIKANHSSPVARFSIVGLDPGAQYLAGLYAFNSKGRSEPVILQASTLRLPEKQLTAEKGTFMMLRYVLKLNPLVIFGIVTMIYGFSMQVGSFTFTFR